MLNKAKHIRYNEIALEAFLGILLCNMQLDRFCKNRNTSDAVRHLVVLKLHGLYTPAVFLILPEHSIASLMIYY